MILHDMLRCSDLFSIKLVKRLILSPFMSPQLPSEYEANPELLFYRITHLNHRQQYLIWAAAVTTAGRGNFSDKVTVEPAAKGESLKTMIEWMTRIHFICRSKAVLREFG